MTRTVLVTGGAGFIGANLVRRLRAAGDQVRIFDNLSSGFEAYLPGGVTLIRGDVLDSTAIAAAATGVDVLVHLAAHASVPGSIMDPRHDFEQNAIGTLNALEAARGANVRRVVIASSNATSGQGHPVARPDLPMRPSSPYGASKATGELYAHAYRAAYQLEVVALRFSNVYGPFSLHKSSVVAAFLRSALAGLPMTIYGTGRQTRDFIHVDDLVGGIAAATEASPESVMQAVFQIGSGMETSILQLAEAVEKIAASPAGVIFRPGRQGDVQRNVSDIGDTKRLLGFAPRIALSEGLQQTADWWRTAAADHSLRALQPLSGSD